MVFETGRHKTRAPIIIQQVKPGFPVDSALVVHASRYFKGDPELSFGECWIYG